MISKDISITKSCIIFLARGFSIDNPSSRKIEVSDASSFSTSVDIFTGFLTFTNLNL